MPFDKYDKQLLTPLDGWQCVFHARVHITKQRLDTGFTRQCHNILFLAQEAVTSGYDIKPDDIERIFQASRMEPQDWSAAS